jgi:hypothetical protein
MRDVELLVRFLAFHFYLPTYPGRMKDFLDQTCERLNDEWPNRHEAVNSAIAKFNAGAEVLIDTLGLDFVARKQNSKSFNRAIFDALIFYSADDRIREKMLENPEAVCVAYREISADPAFLEASESDTAGVPHTLARLSLWGERLRNALAIEFAVPLLRQNENGQDQVRAGIDFNGFWA